MPRFTASFRIMGKDLDPEEISGALGLKPTQSHRRGDARPSAKGRAYAPFDEGLWSLASTRGDEAALDEHLDDLLPRLASRMPALDALKKEGLRRDVFIGVFSREGNFGYAISAANQSRLARLGVELSFDVYG
jgi:hypothetical protein